MGYVLKILNQYSPLKPHLPEKRDIKNVKTSSLSNCIEMDQTTLSTRLTL